MARFPYYQRNVVELGRLIAKAALDESFREKLIDDPNAKLSEIGLPHQTTALMNFKVVDGNTVTNPVALPFRLNQGKLDSNDQDYLSGLTKMFRLN